jgi:hypothetical protein
MAEALALASVAASVVSAGASLAAGAQAQAGARLQRQQYEEERKAAALAASQEEVATRREMESVLSAQEALRGARGLDPLTEGAMTIRRDTMVRGEDDIRTIRVNAGRTDRRLRLGGAMATAQGNQAMLAGAANAVGTLGSLGRRS